MGLCKCPKRQVTNQFCFEHRVNVCEHCMVQNHPKCIVQSYLQWLRDSDYVSNCTLCSTSLENGECVRLICYHVFHWECLSARQASLLANTAPHGHKCPTCNAEIFPTTNLVSPVADVLITLLSRSNWGRNGLGLALLSEASSPTDGNFTPAAATTTTDFTTESTAIAPTSTVTKIHNVHVARSKTNGVFSSVEKSDSPHSVFLMEAFSPSTSSDLHASSRRPLLPRQPPIGGTDHDDNKYKRRTPAEIFARWSRRFYAPSSRPPWRRTWFIVISGIFSFLLIVYVMAAIGRAGKPGDTIDDDWINSNPNAKFHYE